jgi:hypothetical protein
MQREASSGDSVNGRYKLPVFSKFQVGFALLDALKSYPLHSVFFVLALGCKLNWPLSVLAQIFSTKALHD